ncbi:hypothetical protein ACWCQW_45475 [Streptomyces mirabilis]
MPVFPSSFDLSSRTLPCPTGQRRRYDFPWRRRPDTMPSRIDERLADRSARVLIEGTLARGE